LTLVEKLTALNCCIDLYNAFLGTHITIA